MNYQKIDASVVVRLDPGEEIIACLTEIVTNEKITLGSVSGIGAVNTVTLGLFKVGTKEYKSKDLEGDFEIVSLAGTISTMNETPYLHLHMAIGDENLQMFGGHLSKAVVSATAEIIIHRIEGSIDRSFDEKIGLNLLHF